MKKVLTHHFLAFVLFSFVACKLIQPGNNRKPKAQNVSVIAKYTHKVDTSRSRLNWEGSKYIGGSHNGRITISGGELSIKGGIPSSGYFEIDMHSIQVNKDLQRDYASKLVGHLTSEDFFEVEKFPISKLEIESASIDSIKSKFDHKRSNTTRCFRLYLV